MKNIFSRIKSLFYEKSLPAKLNYPIYYVLKESWLTKIPLMPRFLRSLIYISPRLRKKLSHLSVNERIVEIPFVLKLIKKEKAKILDIGCSESPLSLHLASLGYEICAIDLNNYEFKHPNLNFIKGDICKIDLPKEYFDYIIILSTLEHIGLGAYGEKENVCNDKEVIKKVKGFLKKNGEIIITLPYGKKGQSKTQRIYDEESLLSLLKDFKIIEKKYFFGLNHKYWVEVSQKDLENIDSTKITQGVCLILTKKL